MSETTIPSPVRPSSSKAGRGLVPLLLALCLALVPGLGGAAQEASVPAQAQVPGRPLPPAVPEAFPYRLGAVREATMGATALGLYGSSFYFNSLKRSANAADLRDSSIPFFDRLYTSSHSSPMGTAADVLMVSAALAPELAAAAFAPGLDGGKFLTIGVMYVETMGLAYSSAELLKSLVTRYRPYGYSGTVDFGDSELTSSFPSRHAMIAFSSATFAGFAFDKVAPGSPWSPLVWASGLGLATATSVLRVASGDHFPSDVVAGAILGSALGYLVPLLHEKRGGRGPVSQVSLLPTGNGLLLDLSLSP